MQLLNPNNTISILICTYNGEKYLVEQLESIRNQEFKPDKVLIYDDCSTDASVKIINDFISIYNLESTWKLNINPTRKGWKLNFYDALSDCNDDFIFFCDQDDIWNSDKISIMMDIMQKNPDIFVLNGLFETINPNGESVNILNWTSNKDYNRKINKSSFLDTMNIWQHRIGCTMVIRKIIKEQLKYFARSEYFSHDLWSSNIGALFNSCYYFNYPVIQYRIHENNACADIKGKINSSTEKILLIENEYLEYFFNGIRSIDKSLINQHEYLNFLKVISFYKHRLALIRDSNIFCFFRLILKINIYLKYFSFKQFIVDMLDGLRIRDYVRSMKHSILKYFR